MVENKDYSDNFCTLHYRESVRRYCSVKEDGDPRYSAKGKRIKEQSSVIFINIIIPVLLAYARKMNDAVLEKRLFKAYKMHSRLSPNNITRFMNYRILGKDKQRKNVVNTARRQQGLLQIFKDFCESDDIACKRCVLLLSINSME